MANELHVVSKWNKMSAQIRIMGLLVVQWMEMISTTPRMSTTMPITEQQILSDLVTFQS